MRSSWLIAAIALAMPVSALAQEPAPPAAASEDEEPAAPARTPQKPGEKLVALFADLAGTWKCSATLHERGAGSKEVSSTAKIAPVLDGFAYALEHALTPKGGSGTRTMVMWSEDPMTGKLNESGWDSEGSSWRGTSVGLRNDKAIWTQEGVAYGDALRMRTTWTRAGKDLQRLVEVRQTDGRWERTIEETCKK